MGDKDNRMVACPEDPELHYFLWHHYRRRWMNIRDAKLCLNCEEVFQGAACPRCDACYYRPLTTWLKPVAPQCRQARTDDRPLLVGSRGKRSLVLPDGHAGFGGKAA